MPEPSANDTDARLRAIQGTLRSLTEEMRLRMTEAAQDAAATRKSVESLAERLAAIESNVASATGRVDRILLALGGGEEGALSQLRADLEVIQGELVMIRDRVADSELSLLDVITSRPSASAKGAVKDA